MFAFTKFIGLLFMPIGLLWLGLLLAAGWALRRRMLGLGGFLALLFLGLTMAGNPQVGHAMMARLEVPLPSPPKDAMPLDALFVLGGGTQLDVGGRPCLGDCGDRIVEAARLWRAGQVKRLVASGASEDGGDHRRDLGIETREIWRSLGIPDDAIWVIKDPCFNTRAEIQAYRRLQIKEGWRRVGLLSSAWHLPRAQALAEREGLEAWPIPSDRRGRIPRMALWDLVPQSEGISNTQRACWEMLGRRVGR